MSDDPFAPALDALFTSAGSLAAVYAPAVGAPYAIRVIRSRPDEASSFGQGRILQATNSIEVRIADAPGLASGDLVHIGAELLDDTIVGGEPLELIGTPMRDVEGLTFTIGAEPYDA